VEWLAANWTQVLGFVTGAVCVVLAVRRNVWNYPIGLANNVVFFVLFVEAGLYGDSGLQVVFAVLAIHGWVRWTRKVERAYSYIGHTPRAAIPALVASGLAMAGLLWWLLDAATDSTVPFADAVTTAASLVAQYMLNRKWLANWWVWFAVDLVYIGLYVYKDLLLIAVLYAGFAGLCVAGFTGWRAAQARVGERAAAHV
jgi:nicotinamide mononucleotide transporter